MSKYSSSIVSVKVLEKNPPTVRELPLHMFEFHWLDKRVEQFPGKSVSDAFRRGGYGLGALPALDFFVKIPEGESAPEIVQPLFQVFSMKTKKDNFEPCGGLVDSLEFANIILDAEIRDFGKFSSIVVDVNTDKIYTWKWR